MTLWQSSELPGFGSARLAALGRASWSVRIRQGRSWSWDRFDGALSVPLLEAHLGVLPGCDVRVWQPSPELGTVLVDAVSGRRQTLAAWHPFPDPRLADLHRDCFEVSSRVLASHGASDLLGSPLQRRPAAAPRDPAYWLSGAEPLLARAALGLSRARAVPLEAAAASLEVAGFSTLSPEAAEVAAALAGEWSGDVPSLVQTADLIV